MLCVCAPCIHPRVSELNALYPASGSLSLVTCIVMHVISFIYIISYAFDICNGLNPCNVMLGLIKTRSGST